MIEKAVRYKPFPFNIESGNLVILAIPKDAGHTQSSDGSISGSITVPISQSQHYGATVSKGILKAHDNFAVS